MNGKPRTYLLAIKFRICMVALAPIPLVAVAAQPAPSKWSNVEDVALHISISAQAPTGEPESATARVIFSKNYAISAVLDPENRKEEWTDLILFDLEKMAWFDQTRKQWIDLKTCQAWEKASLDRTRASLATMDDAAAKAFAQDMIDPQFQVRNTPEGTLVISNNHLTYSITPATVITRL